MVSRGVASFFFFFLMTKLRVFFFDWSQHLCFRSHGSEAKKEQCVPGSGTDKCSHGQHTSSIHAGSPSIIHTLQSAHAFQTHYQSRDYFLKREYNRCHTTTDRTCCIHAQTSCSGFSLQHHGQLSAILVTAIVVSMGPLAPSSTSHGKILTAHQPARQHALSNSHSRPRRSKVKCHLTCFEHLLSICFSFSDSLICSFVAIFTGFDTKVGIHTGQIRALSLQPYMTISIAFTLTISTT